MVISCVPVAAVAFLAGSIAAGATESTAALTVEDTIPLGAVRGRIDHLAIDVARHRLYVAELGNNSLGVVDLQAGRMTQTVKGLREPQGVGYVPATDSVYVANAGDGSVRVFRGSDLSPIGQIALGSDADNIRISSDGSRVFVGFGDGALAVIDPGTQSLVAQIPLKAHPESFRPETAGSRIFINIPDAHAIAVVDGSSLREIASWSTADLKANFPLVLDGSGHVLAVFRHPARIGVFESQKGALLNSVETCGDADDVFMDPKRSRVYVICGAGFVDTYAQDKEQLRKVGRTATVEGARTGLFVPETDRLYVAARAGFGRPAAVWILKPGA